MYTIFAFFCFAGAFLLCFKTITENIKNGLSMNWESVQVVDIQEHIFTDYLPSKNRGYTIQTKYVYNIKYIIDGKLQDMTLTLFNTKLNPVDLRIEPHTRKIYVRRKLQTRDYTIRLFALFIAALIGLIFIQEIIKKLKKTNKQ
ncbi:hypothetical protein V1L52_12155 [Treponema sp. HNW]|uniref:hypothetical protein n=1 Tax=Treponema sp. HNW TaxID=3116654 RepID=UPI003D150E8E